jgi:signal transduction histidine kinase
VSKRPEAGRGPRFGVRSLVGYLRDARIGIKLGFIMFVPTLATVVVGANGLVGQISTANAADQARTLSTLSEYSGSLVDALQAERADAVMLLGSPAKSANAVAAASKFTAEIGVTDTAATAYTHESLTLADLPDNFKSLLLRIQAQINGIPALRTQIVGQSQIPLSTAAAQYTGLITGLLETRDDSSQLAGDSSLSFEMRAAASIASAKEFLSQERIVVLEAILQNSMPPETRRNYIADSTGQKQAIEAFEVVATPAQAAEYDQVVAGTGLRPSSIDEGLIDQMQSDVLPAGLSATTWTNDMAGRSKLVRQVEQSIDADTVRDATRLRDNVSRQIVIDVGLLFGMVLIAMLIAWSVARSMNRSLRELKQGALTVARHGLPQAVARLRDPTLATQLTPAQIATQIAEPLPVRSRDEFGEVTEAFNAVHLEAVRIAAEQAALRSSVATMFVNLARRSQILVDRLIGHLDQLERGEENPDRLAELFQLDHLATRMRRNDENLLVLAGADSTRVQREPASLIDVLRAAQSEVEHYTRVEFGLIDRDIEVAAHAVNDLVHLVAELFDNATAFSPPDAVVLVEARRIGDRAVLYVEDRGIGISHDQLADLNERLATPPIVDVAVSRMMGLVVVARLAYRHGVKVELRPAADRGTIADVLLPTAVLMPRSLNGRGPATSPPPVLEPPRPQMPPMANVPPRSPFSPPLALESGPSRRESNGAQPVGAGSSLGGFAANAEAFGEAGERLLAANGNNRSLPSWSDLTGATDQGPPADMFGARNGGMGASPLPQRPQRPPVNEWDARPAERSEDRVADQWAEPRPDQWSDRSDQWTDRSADQWSDLRGGADQWNDDRPPIPRQRPQSSGPLDEQQLLDEFAEAELLDERYDAHRYSDDPISAPPAPEPQAPTAAPPIWPPVQAPQASAAIRDDSAQLQLGPGALRAATDMTAEIPKIRDLDLAGAAFGADPLPLRDEDSLDRPVAARSADVPPFADETMELPIFRELESVWFREVAEPGDLTSADAGTPADPFAAESSVRYSTSPARSGASGRPASGGRTQTAEWSPAVAESETPDLSSTMGGTSMTSSTVSSDRPPSTGWRSPADEGWSAAAAASAPPDGGTTDVGLPQRVPMAQLVPGGVDKAATNANRRSPDAVRGLLSAYHRGVQRGRQQSDENNATSESTTGHNPSGGREQEA